MLRQLEEAENELKRKQDDADQDMMMAGMVRGGAEGRSLGKTPRPPPPRHLFPVSFSLYCVFLSRTGSVACVEDKKFGSSARY